MIWQEGETQDDTLSDAAQRRNRRRLPRADGGNAAGLSDRLPSFSGSCPRAVHAACHDARTARFGGEPRRNKTQVGRRNHAGRIQPLRGQPGCVEPGPAPTGPGLDRQPPGRG